MSWTVLIDPDTLEILGQFLTTGASLVDSPGVQCTCEDPTVVMAVRAEDGTIQLLEDPAKLAQKTQAQWTSVRAQQRQKLYESDWTCSVTDYEVPNKAEWVQYRAQLREVTTQADPFAIVWPVRPTA
jgi:hypothetical protein